MRDKKQKPTMLILLLISFAVFTVLSFLGSRRAYRSYALELNIAREPALSMLFRGIHDGVFPWNNGEEREEPLNMEKAAESFFFHISDPVVDDPGVLAEEGDFCWVADGRARPVTPAKRKNKRHLQPIHKVAADRVGLEMGRLPTDEVVRAAIASLTMSKE